MNWLDDVVSRIVGAEAATLDQLLNDLPNIGAVGALSTGAEDVYALLQRVVEKDQAARDALAKALGSLNIDEDGVRKIVDLYARLAAKIGMDRLNALMTPMDKLCPSKPIVFNGEGSVPMTSPAVPDLEMTLGADGNFAIDLDPCPEPPQGLGPVPGDKVAVAIGFKAALKASADAGFQVGFLSLAGQGAAGANAELDYYYLNRPVSPWATALGANLARLASTAFDLRGIAAQLERHELLGIVVTAGGNLSYGGQIGVSAPIELLPQTATQLGAGVGFTARRQGEFEFRVSRAPMGGGLVDLAIRRKKDRSFEQSANFKVRMDATELYRRIKPQLLAGLSKARGVVTELQDLAQPSQWLHEQAAVLLAKNVSDEALQAVAASLLDYDPTQPPRAVLGALLVERIESSGAKWQSDVTAAADALVAQMLLRLPPDVADKLGQSLKKAARKLLQDWFGKTQKRLKAYVEDDGNFAKVADALDEIGQTVAGDLANPNERSQALRDLLTRFQETVGKLRQQVEKATEIKLGLEFAAARSQSDGQELDLRLRFDSSSADARRFYTRAMCGSLAGLFDELRAGDVNGVELLDGSFSGFVSRTAQRGFQFAFVDFSLSVGSILDTSTRYSVDADGNIRIVSKAGMGSSVRLPWEASGLSFAEAMNYAAATKTGLYDLKLVVSHQEEAWSLKEIRQFVGSLPAAGLMSRGTADSVIQYFTDNLKATKKAEMSLTVRLGAAAVQRIARAGEDVLRTAMARALATAYADTHKSMIENGWLTALNDELKVPGRDWSEVILNYDAAVSSRTDDNLNLIDFNDAARSRIARLFVGDSQALGELATLVQLHRVCVDFGAVGQSLAKLNEIAASVGPDVGARELEEGIAPQINNEQGRIVKHLAFFADPLGQGAKAFLRNFVDDEVAPYSLALIQALADLGQVSDQDVLLPVLKLGDDSVVTFNG